MPMIKVICISDTLPPYKFPSYVQVLPEVGDIMLTGDLTEEQTVKSRRFRVDGTIELVLY